MLKRFKSLAMASLAAAGLTAQAADETLQASAQVLEPISISVVRAMTFGKKVASNNGQPNQYKTGSAGNSGGGNGYSVGSQGTDKGLTGIFLVSGSDGETVNVGIAPGGCSDGNTYLTFAVSWSPYSIQTDTRSYTLDRNVHPYGWLTIASDTPSGAYTCDYTVTANYQ